LDLVILSAVRLKRLNSTKNDLYNAVFTQLRGTDNFGADKKYKECECLIGHFDAEDGDHG
jgi:hypothetical protein